MDRIRIVDKTIYLVKLDIFLFIEHSRANLSTSKVQGS